MRFSESSVKEETRSKVGLLVAREDFLKVTGDGEDNNKQRTHHSNEEQGHQDCCEDANDGIHIQGIL